MKSNPLFDLEFLTQLFSQKEREIFARITALDLEELPIEYIEGKVTGGSVNVDGKSAVRRTCSLTMIAHDININDFYWGLKNKFKLEIGLKNTFSFKYPDIIWFKQGIYVITNFNTTQNTNSYTINISGKDKMCLLNGDLAGSLPHTTDFGIEEYHDKINDTVTYTSIPIKNIIREAVQNFGGELAKNIIINDIEDAGLELLEYRGDMPLFMFRQVDSDQFLNMTINPNQKCYINGKETTVNDNSIIYDNLVDLEGETESTIIQLSLNGDEYKIAKFEYGSIPGYRLTDLVYAGELIANIGEPLTSILDKIKNMLGEFEYFYDIHGRFVFQKKANYIDVPFNSINERDEQVYVDAAVNASSPSWNFTDGILISSFQNTPNLLNVRNDFSIWGASKTPSGTEIPIHIRYAIDKKPTIYKTLEGKYYVSSQNEFENIKKEIQSKVEYEIYNRVHAFTPQYTIPEPLNAPKRNEDGSWTAGWWDIRDWYEYYHVIKQEYPNGTMKWYSYNSLEGCLNLYQDMPDFVKNEWYDSDFYNKNTYVWLLERKLQNFGGNQRYHWNLGHGSGNALTSKPRLCTYYESYLDEDGKLHTDEFPEIQEYFIAPFQGCSDSHTFLEFLKKNIEEEGYEVYFFNPNFPNAHSYIELIETQVEKEYTELIDKGYLNLVDWREIIYQMALDYRKHYHEDDFLNNIAKQNPYYPSGHTGYEQYYIDLEGFWKDLYNSNPEIEYIELNYDDGITISEDNLYIQYGYRKVNDEDLKNIKLEDLYVIENSTLQPFIKSSYCRLNADEKNGELYFYLMSDGTMNMGTNDMNILNKVDIKNIYIKNSEQFYVKGTSTKPYLVWKDKSSQPIFVFQQSINENTAEDNQYVLFVWACYDKIDKDLLYIHDEGYIPFKELDTNIKNIYKNNNYIEYISFDELNNYGQIIIGGKKTLEYISYVEGFYSYNHNKDTGNYWHQSITSHPESLIFWFDFLDAEGSDLNRYSVPVIGPRTKSINDKDVKSIYYREIPTTIFQSGEETYEHQTGYTYIQLQPTMENLFTISSKGKSAQERLNELLYNHSYCIETVNVTALPIYHLEPNHRVLIQDHKSHIHGEYIVDKITIPLTYNGTMNISATKAVTNVI